MQQTITSITVNEDLIRVDTPTGYFHLDAYNIYGQLKTIYAQEDIKQYLDDSDFSESDIATLAGNDAFIRRWLYAVANNACIEECKRQAAEEAAQDYLPHKEAE